MENSTNFGPAEKSQWLRRPLSNWEKDIILPSTFQISGGPARATINSVFNVETKIGYEIDLENFRKALRATIYKQPHLRARVDLDSTPIRWLPAEDFEGVFSFVDRRSGEDGSDQSGGVAEIWDLVEEEGNRPWNYDSMKPLFRCVLVKVSNGFVVMNIYHHSVADSISGMHMMDDLMEFYDTLESGKELVVVPLEVRGSAEEETFLDGHQSTIQAIVDAKVERSKMADDYVPFDVDECHRNDSLKLPLTKTIFHEGNENHLKEMRKRCKEEKVTIGCLAVAAHNFAVCVLQALEDKKAGKTFGGIKDHYTEVPVNMRPRLSPPLGPLCGFYVSEVYARTNIDLSTRLWDLAKDVKKQMDTQFDEKHHLLFLQAKEEFETGATSSIAQSIDLTKPLSVVSNVGAYHGRKEFSWGKIRSMHYTGVLVNFLLLLQSTDIMTYDVISIAGDNNESTARKSLEVVVDLMENADKHGDDVDLRSVFRRHDIMA